MYNLIYVYQARLCEELEHTKMRLITITTPSSPRSGKTTVRVLRCTQHFIFITFNHSEPTVR